MFSVIVISWLSCYVPPSSPSDMSHSSLKQNIFVSLVVLKLGTLRCGAIESLPLGGAGKWLRFDTTLLYGQVLLRVPYASPYPKSTLRGEAPENVITCLLNILTRSLSILVIEKWPALGKENRQS